MKIMRILFAIVRHDCNHLMNRYQPKQLFMREIIQRKLYENIILINNLFKI